MEIEYFGSQIAVPENARAIATDVDGCVYAYSNDTPVFNVKTGTWCTYTNSFTLIDVNYDAPAADSLIPVDYLLEMACQL